MDLPENLLDASATMRSARPDPALDPYLDAFARVVMRFGVQRTRMQDVAREAKVDRTTVFRRVGSMDDLIRAYISREVIGFLDETIALVPAELDGTELLVEMIASSIERAREHPVLAKAIADEPDLVGALIMEQLATVVDQIVDVLATGLALLAGIGLIEPIDPDTTAQWIARFGLTAVLVPLPSDLRITLRAVLAPLLSSATTTPAAGGTHQRTFP